MRTKVSYSPAAMGMPAAVDLIRSPSADGSAGAGRPVVPPSLHTFSGKVHAGRGVVVWAWQPRRLQRPKPSSLLRLVGSARKAGVAGIQVSDSAVRAASCVEPALKSAAVCSWLESFPEGKHHEARNARNVIAALAGARHCRMSTFCRAWSRSKDADRWPRRNRTACDRVARL